MRNNTSFSSLFVSSAICISIFLFSLFQPLEIAAQEKWQVGVAPGMNLPLKDLGDANLKTGFGFEATVSYRFMPHLAAYTGWGWSRFSADQSFAGSKIDFEETGYRFGLQFMHPFAQSKINYVLNGGAVYNHIEAENTEGNIIADSGHGWGWQAGAGVAVPCGKHFRLIPGLRYQSLSRTLNVNGSGTDSDLSYLSVQVGLSWTF